MESPAQRRGLPPSSQPQHEGPCSNPGTHACCVCRANAPLGLLLVEVLRAEDVAVVLAFVCRQSRREAHGAVVECLQPGPGRRAVARRPRRRHAVLQRHCNTALQRSPPSGRTWSVLVGPRAVAVVAHVAKSVIAEGRGEAGRKFSFIQMGQRSCPCTAPRRSSMHPGTTKPCSEPLIKPCEGAHRRWIRSAMPFANMGASTSRTMCCSRGQVAREIAIVGGRGQAQGARITLACLAQMQRQGGGDGIAAAAVHMQAARRLHARHEAPEAAPPPCAAPPGNRGRATPRRSQPALCRSCNRLLPPSRLLHPRSCWQAQRWHGYGRRRPAGRPLLARAAAVAVLHKPQCGEQHG